MAAQDAAVQSAGAGSPMTGTYWAEVLVWVIVLALLGQGAGFLLRHLTRRKS